MLREIRGPVGQTFDVDRKAANRRVAEKTTGIGRPQDSGLPMKTNEKEGPEKPGTEPYLGSLSEDLEGSRGSHTEKNTSSV